MVVDPAASWKLSARIGSHWVSLLTSKKTPFWVFGLCFIYWFEVCVALYFLTRCDSHSWMTFISSCARNHAAPRFVSLKAFAARVFTFLCAIAVNIVNLRTFFSKAGAHASSTEVGFKSTAFVTPGTERKSVALCPRGIFVLIFIRFHKYLITFPTLLALEVRNDFALFCMFLDRRPMAQRMRETAQLMNSKFMNRKSVWAVLINWWWNYLRMCIFTIWPVLYMWLNNIHHRKSLLFPLVGC